MTFQWTPSVKKLTVKTPERNILLFSSLTACFNFISMLSRIIIKATSCYPFLRTGIKTAEPLQGDRLLLTNEDPRNLGIHLIDPGRMNG